MTAEEPSLIETDETEVQPSQASEQVLGKDWLNPLEDEAWQDL